MSTEISGKADDPARGTAAAGKGSDASGAAGRTTSSGKGLHPFIEERMRADGLLHLSQLFAPDPGALAGVLLHAELLESAVGMREERLSEARLEWWTQTLEFEPERHPLTAGALRGVLQSAPGARRSLHAVLRGVPDWRTPASLDALWNQAMPLAAVLAELWQGHAATLLVHGLMCRMRQPGVSGPHNPGLCPLDLRARHQLAEAPLPQAWPHALRQDWAQGLGSRLRAAPGAGARFDQVLRGLLLRELERLAHPRWQPARAGRGLGAVWRAWQAARRAA